MALTRHEHRRKMVVADANAIGDFYQTVGMTKEPMRTELQRKITEYAKLHLSIAAQPFEAARWEDAVRRNQTAQSEMEGIVSSIIDQGTPVTVPLMQTFNQLTSVGAEDRRSRGSSALERSIHAAVVRGCERGSRRL